MNSETMSWGERLVAASATLLAMFWTYWTFLRKPTPKKQPIIDNQTEPEATLQETVYEKIQEIREEVVSNQIQEELPKLVEEAKENSKDAQTAAAALENSQL